MRIVLFDLGDTLEQATPDNREVLLPGAIETLSAIRKMRDGDGAAPVLALASDFDDEATTGRVGGSPQEVRAAQRQYFKLIEDLGISSFFKQKKRVTLSIEVGVRKPDARFFRTAIDKIHKDLPFHHALFVTENPDHITAARAMGLMAIHFKGPGQTTGEVDRLVDLIDLVEKSIAFAPCGKERAEAVGLEVSVAKKGKKQDPAIKTLVSKVSPDRLRKTVKRLAEFGTRWSYSPNIGKVPEWIHEQFVVLGYPSGAITRYQQFEMPGSGKQRNVLCGSQAGDKGILLICGHYDSISEDPSAAAPGADDNASGVAAILEIAKILKSVELKRRVLFAVFGGEEQGLFGSAACADIAAKDHWPIDVVINLDMISYKTPGKPGRITVEYDQGNKHPGNDAAAKAFGLTMAQAASDYTSLKVEHTDIWNSDYLPFEAKGFACIGAYNAYENPFYHKSSDTPDKIDFAHFAEAVRMVLATVLIIGG